MYRFVMFISITDHVCTSFWLSFLILSLHLRFCVLEDLSEQEKQIRKRVEVENVDSPFGVLYSQVDYTKWAVKEEVHIVKTFASRLKWLKTQRKIIRKYPSDSSSNNKHKIKWKLSRRMLDHLRNLEFLEKFVKNQNTMTQVLKETQPFVVSDVSEKGTNLSRLAPSSEDLWLTMGSYFDVGTVYGYSPYQLISGFNPAHFHLQNGTKLKAQHCLEIGVFALFRGQYQKSVEWFKMSSRRFSQVINFASSLLDLAVQHHNKLIVGAQAQFNFETIVHYYTTPITKLNPFPDSTRDVIYRSNKGFGSNGYISPLAQFWDVCMEKSVVPPEVVSKLKCHLENKRHPYLYINPVKVEHLSENPPIYQLYQIVGDKTIQKINKENGGKIHPSKHAPLEKGRIPTIRTNGVRVLLSEEIPELMIKIPEAVTGIRFAGNTELFQFVEYTPGRLFNSHPDLVQWFKGENVLSPHDNLLATLLYYLEVPQVGGFTAFSQAGVHSKHARGSAIIWLNMYRNGTIRQDVVHGGCPVLEGQKITINRWSRYLSNWDKFQCKPEQFK